MANKDQQYLINRFIGIIADNFCNEDIVVNVITTICDEEISISESEPMDIFWNCQSFYNLRWFYAKWYLTNIPFSSHLNLRKVKFGDYSIVTLFKVRDRLLLRLHKRVVFAFGFMQSEIGDSSITVSFKVRGWFCYYVSYKRTEIVFGATQSQIWWLFHWHVSLAGERLLFRRYKRSLFLFGVTKNDNWWLFHCHVQNT